MAALGAFYDSSIDNFIAGSNLFKEKLVEDEDFDSIDNTSQRIVSKNSDSFDDKCDSMDIQGEVKLSVALGLITVKGSARYATRKQSSKKMATLSIHYAKNTATEEIGLINAKKKVDFEGLDEETNATHVVMAINWGGNCVLHCSYERAKVSNFYYN